MFEQIIQLMGLSYQFRKMSSFVQSFGLYIKKRYGDFRNHSGTFSIFQIEKEDRK
jgi:hypothetical protein